MLALGIESTAHTFGVSIVDSDCNILSNKRKLYTTEEGGLIPAELSDHHTDIFDTMISEALDESGKTLSDIDLIAFSQSPGIGHALRVGACVARSLALKLNIPLIGVNHCIAHLEIGIKKGKDITSEDSNSDSLNSDLPKTNLLNSDSTNPATCSDPILLYASGANTQIIGYEGKKYRIFGETLDNGIGNFLDGFARYIGLGFPGGPKIQKLAESGSELIELSYSVKGMDLSFGGIQTRLKQLWDSGKYSKEDLCYSAQEYAFSMLIEVSERALAHTGKTELLLGGGVACNTRLQEMAKKMCEDRGAKCFVLPNELNVDNAAMIAWTGVLQHAGNRGAECSNGDQKLDSVHRSLKESKIQPYLRTDEIDITWRN